MNKLEILDKLIDYEDKLESELSEKIPIQVTEEMKRLYGEDGVRIANTYYKKSDSIEDKDDCPECTKKAQELIKLMTLSQTITDALTKDEIDETYQSMKQFDMTNFFDYVISQLTNKIVNRKMVRLALIKHLALMEDSK